MRSSDSRRAGARRCRMCRSAGRCRPSAASIVLSFAQIIMRLEIRGCFVKTEYDSPPSPGAPRGAGRVSTPVENFDRSSHLRGSPEILGGQAARPISTGKLRALPRFHIRPINHVVYVGSSGALTAFGTPYLEGGFPLRCFQRLSRPNIATRQCRWRDNRNTRGSSNPVLSY